MSLPCTENHRRRENAGPFRNWELAKKAYAGRLLPSEWESSSREAPGVKSAVLFKKRAGRGSRLSPLPVGGGRVSYSSHPAAAHPSQMPLPAALRPHTAAQSHCGLWQLSLLVIIPWEQTCFLFQGRPGERARRARKRRGRHSATLEAKLLFHRMTWAFIPKPADTNSKT